MHTRFPARVGPIALGLAMVLPYATESLVAQASSVPSPSIEVDDRVEHVTGSNGVLYAAGRFGNAIVNRTTFVPRTGVVAWNARTGDLLPWAPVITDSRWPIRVDTIEISPDGETIYIGGVFDDVNGFDRRNIVAVDRQGNVTSWRGSGINIGRVWDIELNHDGSRLYAAGEYGIQAWSTAPVNQQADPAFQPSVTDDAGNREAVWSLALSPDGSVLYFGSGGHFKRVNNVPREGLAAVDAFDGSLVASFYPGLRDPLNRLPYVEVYDVIFYKGQVYAFGDWWETIIAGQWRGSGRYQLECCRFDPVTGDGDPTMVPWADGGFQGGDIDPIGNLIYGVGHFDQVGAEHDTINTTVYRKDTVTVDLLQGSPRTWRPGTLHSSAKSQLYGTDVVSGKCVIGGVFESTNGVDQRNVAMFEIEDRECLFVVGDPNALQPLDRWIQTRLERTLGFAVTLQDDEVGDGSEADDKALVVISNSARWSNVLDRYKATEAPVLTWNASLLRHMGLTRGWWNTDVGVENLAGLDIVDPGHPIAEDTDQTQLGVYGQSYPVVWCQPVAAAHVVAQTPTGRPTLFTLQTGDALFDGTPCAGNRVVFPLRREFGTSAPDFNHHLWPLFDNAVRYMIDGGGAAVQRLTRGCAAGLSPMLEFRGVPRINDRFSVDLYYAPANQPVVLYADFDQPFPQVVSTGCSAVAYSPTAEGFSNVVAPWGRASWRFPLGSVPAFIGQTLNLQAVIYNPGGPYNGSYALSEGYRVRIQP